jgi:hypothetical protein
MDRIGCNSEHGEGDGANAGIDDGMIDSRLISLGSTRMRLCVK